MYQKRTKPKPVFYKEDGATKIANELQESFKWQQPLPRPDIMQLLGWFLTCRCDRLRAQYFIHKKGRPKYSKETDLKQIIMSMRALKIIKNSLILPQ